jgi:hypothetical protein
MNQFRAMWLVAARVLKIKLQAAFFQLRRERTQL